MNMEKKINKIKFKYGFITLNRNLDRWIFKDSKLLSLLIYIALRVAREKTRIIHNLNILILESGQFVIGRPSTVENTDLTEAEFRSRFKKLKELRIIKVVKTTSQCTICQWLENDFIDLNIPPAIQPTDSQQADLKSATNNNLSSFITSKLLINDEYTVEEYISVLKAYMYYKEIELRGKETYSVLYTIKDMFEAKRKKEQIINFMKWLKQNEDDEHYLWVRSWTIGTVQKKLPEFLAGKLEIPTVADFYKDLPCSKEGDKDGQSQF